MIITRKHVSRRTVLGGVGATLALPLLDSMVPAFASARELAAATTVRRFGAIYVGMGMDMKTWAQPADGSHRLSALSRVRICVPR